MLGMDYEKLLLPLLGMDYKKIEEFLIQIDKKVKTKSKYILFNVKTERRMTKGASTHALFQSTQRMRLRRSGHWN